MKKIFVGFLLLAVLLTFTVSPAPAASVKIIASPTLPGVDAAWLGVALGMGHAAMISPIGDLDFTFWIPGTDVLIISDPFAPYTPLQIANVSAAMAAGVRIYIQSEDAPGDPGNFMFFTVVNSTGSAGFAWFGPAPGAITARIKGPLATQFNPRKPVLSMMGGCFGGSPGVFTGIVPNLVTSAGNLGFLYDDITIATAGLVATSTDVEWIMPFGPDIPLMENYIDVLITNVELTHFFPIPAPAGTITLPAAGGVVTYSVSPTNIGFSLFPTTMWTRVFLPSGMLYPPPLAGPVTFVVPPLTAMGPFILTVAVPPFAPPGTYYLQSMMASGYPLFGLVYDTDFFVIMKMVVSADGTRQPEQREQILIPGGDLGAQVTATAEQRPFESPSRFVLGESYPNPFNPSTTINLTLPEATDLSVVVYDLQGREVAILAHGVFSAGQHSFSFDAHGLAGGVYFLRASAGSEVQTRKLILMK